MADKTDSLPVNGEVSVELAGGGRLKLLLDINAMVAVEDQLGMDIELAGQVLSGAATIPENVKPVGRLRMVRTFFWAALLVNDSSITEHRAGEIMTEVGPQKAADLVSKAFAAAFPQEGEGLDPTKGPKAKPPRK
jgi:hypothetical protein